MVSLLLLLACSDTPSVRGRVVDVWNNPIEDAKVLTGNESPTTDSHGVFELTKTAPGSVTLKAGKEGYIQEELTFDLTAETTTAPTFKLYKKPDQNGFHALTVGDYRTIPPSTVELIGHKNDATYGIEPPDNRIFIEGDKLEIVYKIDLSLPQIKALGLKLKKLSFTEKTTMKSIAGGVETEVPINLFVADKQVPIEIAALNSANHFMLRTTEPLEPGVYALESQNLLQPKDPVAWSRIPAGLRNVYAFTVRK